MSNKISYKFDSITGIQEAIRFMNKFSIGKFVFKYNMAMSLCDDGRECYRCPYSNTGYPCPKSYKNAFRGRVDHFACPSSHYYRENVCDIDGVDDLGRDIILNGRSMLYLLKKVLNYDAEADTIEISRCVLEGIAEWDPNPEGDSGWNDRFLLSLYVDYNDDVKWYLIWMGYTDRYVQKHPDGIGKLVWGKEEFLNYAINTLDWPHRAHRK